MSKGQVMGERAQFLEEGDRQLPESLVPLVVREGLCGLARSKVIRDCPILKKACAAESCNTDDTCYGREAPGDALPSLRLASWATTAMDGVTCPASNVLCTSEICIGRGMCAQNDQPVR